MEKKKKKQVMDLEVTYIYIYVTTLLSKQRAFVCMLRSNLHLLRLLHCRQILYHWATRETQRALTYQENWAKMITGPSWSWYLKLLPHVPQALHLLFLRNTYLLTYYIPYFVFCFSLLKCKLMKTVFFLGGVYVYWEIIVKQQIIWKQSLLSQHFKTVAEEKMSD